MFLGGKLPMMTMGLRPGPSYPGRTYRFYNGPVVYPFGHALSYTTFTHEILNAPTAVTVPIAGYRRPHNATDFSGEAIRVTHTKCNRLSLVIHVAVRNTGRHDGPYTLLDRSTGRHEAQAQKEVQINIHVCKFLSVVDRFGNRRVPMGEHGIHIGDVRHSVSLQAETLGIIKS